MNATRLTIAFLTCAALQYPPHASAKSLETQSLETQSLEAQSLEAQSLDAQSLDAQTSPTQGPLSTQQSNQQQQPSVNHSAMNDSHDSAPNSGVSGQMMKDKIFLRKAAQGGMAEVQLGQLASEKAGSQEVKDFGSKMVTDHTALNDEIKPIADSMGVMLPRKVNAKDQAEYDKLNTMSGDDFDREYLSFMVKDHHEDLREFRMEAAATTDPTLKAAVEKGTRVIREHTTMVDTLARSKGLSVPAHGPRQQSTSPASQ